MSTIHLCTDGGDLAYNQAGIYGLTCACENCDPYDIRYIGLSKDVRWRLYHHIYKSSISKSASAKWIKSHGIENLRILLLESCSEEWLTKREIFWIEHYNTFHDQNPHGLNLTKGGEFGVLGYAHSEETRRKISESQQGIPRSEETRQRISTALRGRKHTEISKAKMSASHTGVKLSEARVESNRRASHIRWHLNRNVINQQCDFCAISPS